MILNFISGNSIAIIWLIFTGMFFYMTWREFKKSKQPLESLRGAFFKNTELGVSGSITMMGIDFESFAHELEKSNQESHRIAATAYCLAGLTALASFILVFM